MTIIQQLALNLISGLMGSIIGAYYSSRSVLKAAEISYKGAIDAATKSMENLFALEKEKREWEKSEQTKAMLLSLLAEAEENVHIGMVTGTRSQMSTEAWSACKAVVPLQENSLQRALFEAYSAIKRYNWFIERSLTPGLSPPNLSQQIDGAAKNAMKCCQLVVTSCSICKGVPRHPVMPQTGKPPSPGYFLDHASIKVPLDTYGHLMEEVNPEAAQRLEELIFKASLQRSS